VSAAAPYFAEVADGPPGHAVWLTAADGLRIRAGFWPLAGAKGTVLLLPGRSEYVEKYGRAARDLALRGYATACVDWRGQGLADRAFDDRMVGHVEDFAAYQRDVDALLAGCAAEAMPRPWFLLAHSMGGCIGLRALVRGVPVQAAAFSAPMWGIMIGAWTRPLAILLTNASRWFSFDHRYAPGTGAKTYVVEAPFAGNTLTSDPAMWDYMKQQALAHPDLVLGGPSLGWLKAALVECHALALLPSPRLPVYCALGLAEKIVDTGPVHLRMAAWPGATFDLVEGAEHEVMMETPAIRKRFFDRASALFDAQLTS
jgi:lysophospholipase